MRATTTKSNGFQNKKTNSTGYTVSAVRNGNHHFQWWRMSFSASVDNFIKIVEINRNPQIDLDKFVESYDTKEEGHIEENEIEDLR